MYICDHSYASKQNLRLPGLPVGIPRACHIIVGFLTEHYHREIHPFLPFSQMTQGMRWKQSSKYPHLSHTVVAYHIMVRVQYSTLLPIPYAPFIKTDD